MAKAGRAACIFTPMALSIASLVCIILINLGGYSKHSDTLNDLYFFKADFTNFTTPSTSTELSIVLQAAVESGEIADFYQIHLWNYCTGNDTSSSSTSNGSAEVSWCSSRQRNFWFNPLEVWDVSSVLNSTASSLGVSSSILETLTSTNVTALEDDVLGKSARTALKTYHKVSTWMFTAYFASFFLLLATIIFGVLAVFSRWFSFLTWFLSFVSTILVFGASITATIMFPILVKALNETLEDYNVYFTTSTHTLGVTWLAMAFTLLATLFWLLSCCCCSGSSNPHHRSNQDAPAKNFGFGGGNKGSIMSGGRGRSLRGEKPADYQRVESPYAGGHESDNVPLTQVAAPPYGHHSTEYGHHDGEANSYYQPQNKHTGAFEPYRHA